MGDSSPTAFRCTVLGWNEIQAMARDVALAVAMDPAFDPDVIVGLARGGWCPTRCVCDVLEHDDATSTKVEHYTGTATTDDGPTTRYEVDEGAVDGKDVLLVDDIVDSGASVQHASAALSEKGATEVRTAVLQELPSSEVKPDYVAESLDTFAWVVYPWNVVEDVHDIIEKLSDGKAASYSYDDLRDELAETYGLDQQELARLSLPLDEILHILDARDALSFDGSTVTIPSDDQPNS